MSCKKGKSVIVVSSQSEEGKKRKPKYIYTVTCIYDIPYYCRRAKNKTELEKKKEEYWSHGGSRCFGWVSSLKEAKNVVENNRSDIHEYSYKYAVIEKIADGLRGGYKLPKEWWYEWKGDHENGQYISVDKPEELKSVIHWGIG